MGELEDAIVANRDALVQLSQPDIDELRSVLRAAQRELREKLNAIPKDADSYDAHKARSVLVQMDRATRDLNRHAAHALDRDLTSGGRRAGNTATAKLARIVKAGEHDYPGSVQPIRIDVAAVLAKSERTFIGRFSRRAGAYGAELERDIRRSLMSGIMRGESIHEMASRVLKGTGLVRHLTGDANAQLDAIAARPFNRMRSVANCIARTEVSNAYNAVQLDQLVEMNKDDPGYLKGWDAATDKVCPLCMELDGETVPLDSDFPGGYERPPAHPNCRCTTVAWRIEWGGRKFTDVFPGAFSPPAADLDG